MQVNQVVQAIENQSDAQQTGNHHAQHLGIHHKFIAAGGNHALGIEKNAQAAQQKDDNVENDCNLQLAHALLAEGVVPFFGTGDNFAFQLPKPVVVGKADGICALVRGFRLLGGRIHPHRGFGLEGRFLRGFRRRLTGFGIRLCLEGLGEVGQRAGGIEIGGGGRHILGGLREQLACLSGNVAVCIGKGGFLRCILQVAQNIGNLAGVPGGVILGGCLVELLHHKLQVKAEFLFFIVHKHPPNQPRR